MAETLPYMQSYGYIGKILDKIKHAQTPDRFTYDFLGSKLLVKASAARPFIPFAKRLGLLDQDGSPTDLYKAFRSTDESTARAAMAEAVRRGYRQLYEANERAHELATGHLEGLIIQLTGLGKGSKMARNIAASFEALKPYADFGAALQRPPKAAEDEGPPSFPVTEAAPAVPAVGLTYQINLVLPRTDDIAVFNAIFRSLRENLLRQ